MCLRDPPLRATISRIVTAYLIAVIQKQLQFDMSEHAVHHFIEETSMNHIRVRNAACAIQHGYHAHTWRQKKKRKEAKMAGLVGRMGRNEAAHRNMMLAHLREVRKARRSLNALFPKEFDASLRVAVWARVWAQPLLRAQQTPVARSWLLAKYILLRCASNPCPRPDFMRLCCIRPGPLSMDHAHRSVGKGRRTE